MRLGSWRRDARFGAYAPLPKRACLRAALRVPAALPTPCAGHEPAPRAGRLDRVAAAQAVRALVSGVEGIGDAAASCSRFLGGQRRRWLSGLGWLPFRGGWFGRRARPGRLCWLPNRHHVRDWLGRHRCDRLGRRGGRPRGFRGETVVPGRCKDLGSSSVALVVPGGRPSRRQAHHLDDPAAGGAAPARNAPQFSLLGRSRLAAAHACEDVVDLGHGTPGGVRVRDQIRAQRSTGDLLVWRSCERLAVPFLNSGCDLCTGKQLDQVDKA